MRFIYTLLSLAITFSLPAVAQQPSIENDAQKLSSSEIAKSALAYIKRLQFGKVDIVTDTALSANCSLQRRNEIRKQIEFLMRSSYSKSDNLTLLAQRTDGNLAGVLVQAENPASPLQTRVHAIALIKRNNKWLPTPIPGNFSNTGYGYDEGIEQRVSQLETWLNLEKNRRESRSRIASRNALDKKLQEHEANAKLKDKSPEEAVEYLIQQCRQRNLMGVLAAMGAASGALQDPLEATLDVVSQGLDTTEAENDWLLMTSSQVAWQVLEIDNTRNEVAVGFLNPIQSTKPKILFFPFQTKEGKTFVRLSPLLKIALLPEDQRWQQRWRNRRANEKDLQAKFPYTLLKNTPSEPADSPEELVKRLTQAITENQFSDCISMIPRQGDHYSKEGNQKTSLMHLSLLWRDISRLRSHPRKFLEPLVMDGIALLPIQHAITHRPGKFETLKIWIYRQENQWFWTASDSLKEVLGKDRINASKKLLSRLRASESKQQNDHSKSLLSSVTVLTPPISKEAPDEKKAHEIFEKFRAALRSKNKQAALRSCAVIKGTDNTQTLKVFNYALRGAADHIRDDQILTTTQSGNWRGISVRTVSKTSEVADYPLYLTVATENGPKILLDVDLRLATNKGREMLNKKILTKLEKALPKESLAHINTIFSAHIKASQAEIEKQKKLHE